MHVTAISTVPPDDARHTQGIPSTVASLIDSLADAGLAVTGADVKATHPLARLITRAAAVYEFHRDDAYTPTELVEFAALADEGPVVFRLGNGPLRNVDGENLQAPGKQVKVPVARDAFERRQASLSALAERGLVADASVPAVIGAAEAVLRPHAEIERMMRAQALIGHVAAVILAGEAPETDDVVSVGRETMTAAERRFLTEVGAGLAPGNTFEVTEDLQRRARLHVVSAAAADALAWLIGRIDVAPGRLRADACDPADWTLEPAAAPAGSGVRPLDAILDAYDLHHLVHHSGPAWAGEEGRTLAAGWNRALGWAVWPAASWGQAERVI